MKKMVRQANDFINESIEGARVSLHKSMKLNKLTTNVFEFLDKHKKLIGLAAVAYLVITYLFDEEEE